MAARAPIGGLQGRQRQSEDDVVDRIERHLPLVRHIVFELAAHYPRHVDREELVRAGALGLVEAAQRYDGARGVPFDYFAARRIRGAVLDAVRAADWAPRSVRNLARRLDQAEQALANELGRGPTADELCEALGVSPTELNALQDRIFRSVVLALEQEVRDEVDDEQVQLVDVLIDRDQQEPCEELCDRELRAYVRDAVGLLPERLQLVIVGYFLEGRTSRDLSELLGVTESRVSQLRSEGLALLRTGIEAQYDRSVERSAASCVRSGPRRASHLRARYVSAIGEASAWRSRLDDATGSTAPTPVAV